MKAKSLRKEIFYYLIIGVFVVAVDFLAYLFYHRSLSIDLSNSKRLSYLTGAVVSFFLNKTITFESSKQNLREPFLFIMLYLISFISNSITHDIAVNFLNGSYPFYLSTALSVSINYLGQKFIVFKKK
jgi:putative flippase GtrA